MTPLFFPSITDAPSDPRATSLFLKSSHSITVSAALLIALITWGAVPCSTWQHQTKLVLFIPALQLQMNTISLSIVALSMLPSTMTEMNLLLVSFSFISSH